MESKELSLPLIHHHPMTRWNDLRRGDCCGRLEPISDGYYCKRCNFFVHKLCGESPESLKHPYHNHTILLESKPNDQYCYCDLCGRDIENLYYSCVPCNFVVDPFCAKYPPPEVIHTSETHHHMLILQKERIQFHCGARCGKVGEGFPYTCKECHESFHVGCVWDPPEAKQPSPEVVSLPLIHRHLMVRRNDLRRGDCCGRWEAISDGYYCRDCDLFFHRKCVDNSPETIKHPYHGDHTLWLQSKPDGGRFCYLCGTDIQNLRYCCWMCDDFQLDVFCAKYPPPYIIDIFKTHHHELTRLRYRILFDCVACKREGEGIPYKCHECDVYFHVDCVWNPEAKHPSELNHIYHPLHPFKLHIGRAPDYSDGKCRLCGKKIDDRLFYHCSTCNFSLDMRCVLNTPPQSVLDLKAHAHPLIFRPRLDSFTCNACGLIGDRCPYICLQCDFMIHPDCLFLPRVININRHDHRVSRVSILGVVNCKCGVCHQKVDWTWGGYSCQRCPQYYVVHSKCATRNDVWNGKELEGILEKEEDIEPYVIIDDNTIQHFSHIEHYLRFHVNGLTWEETKRCSACTHPIGLGSFYGCIDCDFFLHKRCAESPRKKWHMLHNDRLTLVVAEEFLCAVCKRASSGFKYECGDMELDVLCGFLSEPFIHPSHPHTLDYDPRLKGKQCNVCLGDTSTEHVLTCIESGCGFALCFYCATLPQVVKHRVDDHPLSLCYGEKASGQYWCDICETELNPEIWFYTCKDNRACLHKKCVLGENSALMPRSTIGRFEVVLNDMPRILPILTSILQAY